MSFPHRDDERWLALYEITKRYIKKYLTPPSALHEFEGEKIGQWYRNQSRLIDDGSILPHRHELLGKLRDYTHQVGIEHFKAYTHKTGFLPLEKAMMGDCRIGKWFIALRNDYKNNRIQAETMEQLSKICDEWNGVQTKIIGMDWVDNVPFGDIPITIVLPDDECIKFLKIGIYGCAQLYEYCDNLFSDIEETRNEERILRYGQARDLKTNILKVLFPSRVPQYNLLLKAIFGEKSLNQVFDCMRLMDNASKVASTRKDLTNTGLPSYDDFATAIGSIFAENKELGLVDHESDDEDIETNADVFDDSDLFEWFDDDDIDWCDIEDDED